MAQHIVNEPDSIHDKMRESNVAIGDTIEYVSNNQEGYAKYKVVRDDDGDKRLTQTHGMDGPLYDGDDSDDEGVGESPDMAGGKRKRRSIRRNRSYGNGSKHKKSGRKSNGTKNGKHKKGGGKKGKTMKKRLIDTKRKPVKVKTIKRKSNASSKRRNTKTTTKRR